MLCFTREDEDLYSVILLYAADLRLTGGAPPEGVLLAPLDTPVGGGGWEKETGCRPSDHALSKSRGIGFANGILRRWRAAAASDDASSPPSVRPGMSGASAVDRDH